jgi:hypothetical protein
LSVPFPPLGLFLPLEDPNEYNNNNGFSTEGGGWRVEGGGWRDLEVCVFVCCVVGAW